MPKLPILTRGPKRSKVYRYLDVATGNLSQQSFESAMPFSEGLAAVEQKGRWGYIDEDYQFVVSPEYNLSFRFTNGRGGVRAKIGRELKEGFVDSQGELVIAPRFDDANFFCEAKALVFEEGRGWSFVDLWGDQKSQVYENAGGFADGLAPVCVDGKWGYVDHEDRVVIPCTFESAWQFSEGLAQVMTSGERAFIDRSGQVVFHVEPGWFPGSFSESLCEFCAGDMFAPSSYRGYLDRKGAEAIEPHYQHAHDFHEGVAAVQWGNFMGYISPADEWVLPARYFKAGDFNDGVAFVEFDKEVAVIDRTGKHLWQGPYLPEGPLPC